MNLNVFIGYDPRQPIGFQVLAHSIWRHSSCPVSITRLELSKVPTKRRGLTEFTYSRFLVPFLSNFQGHSLFLDSDILCRADVFDLMPWIVAYPDSSVCVVKGSRKFEWPSVMLFNNAQCKSLMPEYVGDEQNSLFDFAWAKEVINLPAQWNHLVGYDAVNPDAKLVHFTQGLPVWPETAKCEFADEWLNELRNANSTVSFNDLMGRSVHAPFVAQRYQSEQQPA
jgi:hypothetical protein